MNVVADAVTIDDAVLRLRDRLTGLTLSDSHIIRLVEPLATDLGNLLHWLDAQDADRRIYWHDRNGELSIVGIGAAAVVAVEPQHDHNQLFDQMRALLPQDDSNDYPCRWFGGLAFEPERAKISEPWQPFGIGEFVIPAITLERHGDQTILTANIVAANRDQVSALLTSLRSPEKQGQALPGVIRTSFDPVRATWIEIVSEAITHLRLSGNAKIVLAREVQVALDATPPAGDLLHRLGDISERTFHWLYQPQAGSVWLGASPEGLFSRRGRWIRSEAIAGTIPRSSNPDEDQARRDALWTSDKNRREQEVVDRHIADRLNRLCTTTQLDSEPSILTLTRLHHLISRFEGTLRDEITDADLLREFHPTPAVAGHPIEWSLDTIYQRESFDRGWYAGPIGWVTADGAEFAVGLRSGLIDNASLHLYSGAGIMPDSEPDAEWEEIDAKIGGWLSLLGPR